MKNLYHFNSAENYNKVLVRLEKNISTGRFAAYTQQKKQQVWNRLCRYARQIGIAVKGSLAAACIAAGLSLVASSAKAQTFVQQTGAANPFNSFNKVIVGDAPHPTFADIDGDGDQDAFTCDDYGQIYYYKNTGTKTSPVFTLETGAANPLGSINYSSPWVIAFADLDGDGDMDAIIGGYYGSILYYENTGTKTAPVFTQQLGAANPFDGIVNGDGFTAALAFADVDGDGDMDMVAGDADGNLFYYENTGTKTAPVFTLETGAANPFNTIQVEYNATPALVDVDNDGDVDLFIGDYYGNITYYKNTGTKTAPIFTLETAANNPFNAVNTESFAAPYFVDIDGDGDQDAFIGGGDSTISYYENMLIFPVRLLSFTGGQKGVENYLQWQTTNEVNTADFEVERSAAATTFTTLGKVTATGNSVSEKTYNFTDVQPLQGKNYYRLKMADKDGKFTYSNVVELTTNIPNGIKVFPNPTASVLYITPNNAATNAGNIALSLKDINGKVLWSMQSTNTSQIQADVSKLPNGTYMLEILNTDKTISTQKVVISR